MKHAVCCAEHDEFDSHCADCRALAIMAQEWLRDQQREGER